MKKPVARKPASKKVAKRKPAPKPVARGVAPSRSRVKTLTLPARAEVAPADTWDLAVMFPDDTAWEVAFAQWEKQIDRYATFKGRLGEGPATLREFFEFDRDFDRAGDKLGTYAYLMASGDQADSEHQRRKGRYSHVATKSSEAAAFLRPELLALPQETLDAYLASPDLSDWRLTLERIVRYRPHTLGDKEERLLAMQGQMSAASSQIFRQLNDADLKWGKVRNEKGVAVELSHSTFSLLLESPKRSVRSEAFHAFYAQFDAHKNTIAASLNGSVQTDAYYAKARGFGSARESALFGDNVPVAVYDNLIASVRKGLPTLHKFYDLRRRAMRLRDIHVYDVYTPIVTGVKQRHVWEDGARAVVDALEPLGDEYCRTLLEGLTTARWCDRYPNRGKQSGAFSSGSFDGLPYILMNYQPDLLDHVFTLAHEAGHSMHSWYSARNQPYQYHAYTIFVAEVASTFNEMLLGRHLMAKAKTKKERAFLVNKAIDDIRGTIVRQTMFAEFEKVTHDLVEAGEPLTVGTLRGEYRKLLDAYFGPEFVIDPVLELECLRIPHFYRAFYVYKYATGLSAAIALSERVLNGGRAELDAYLGFLKAGGSKWPIDILRDAGVDMNTPEPVEAAMRRLGALVEELDELL